jgi:hypothetical protein
LVVGGVGGFSTSLVVSRSFLVVGGSGLRKGRAFSLSEAGGVGGS